VRPKSPWAPNLPIAGRSADILNRQALWPGAFWDDLDRTLREAEALIKEPTSKVVPRATLNDAEIRRMAEYVNANALAWDERTRYGRDELKRMEAEHLRLEGRPLSGPGMARMRKLRSFPTRRDAWSD
jgi:hypothetical protein